MTSRTLCAIATVAVWLAIAPRSRAQETWVVDDDFVECPTADFSTIWEAVAAAGPGATIRACPGSYVGQPPEPPGPGRIFIDKPLTVLGPNAGVDGCTGIRGPEAEIEALVRIAADHVTIEGFFLTGDHWANITHEPGPPTDDARILFNVFDGYGRYGVLNRPGIPAAGWLIEHNRFSNWTAPDGAAMRLRNAPSTQVRQNCVYHDDPGMPNAHGMEMSAVDGSVVADNGFGPLSGDGIQLFDWDGPTFGLAIERNDLTQVAVGIRTEGGNHPMAYLGIRDNRIADSHWDAITIWSGLYGPLFIEGNEIVNGPAEAIHVEGHPVHHYPAVHINSNRIENVQWPAINLARGDFGFVHIGDNEITGAGAGIQLEGGGIGIGELHVNANRLRDVRGPAIGLQPNIYNFVHMGWNTIDQDAALLPWDVGTIDIRLGGLPVGPILVIENTIGLRGAGPAVFGVNLVGPAHEFTLAGNDLVSEGVPNSTGFVAGAPGWPPFPDDARIRIDCNEFAGFEWGVRTVAPDASPGGFPPPPAEFRMEQNGFRDVGLAVDNGPPGASAEIQAPWNWWGSDDPPPDFANVNESPFLTYTEYDFDGDGIRNCRDRDGDADGVPMEADLCPMTIQDGLSGDLGPNQWRLAGEPGGFFFETLQKGRGQAVREYTLEDTRGCSCFQILGELDARGYFWSIAPDTFEPVYDGFDGHAKKGCSPSVMDAWLYVIAHDELPPAEEPPAGKGDAGAPEAFTLHAAYPNPFNPSATVIFDVPEPAEVRVAVFDVLGREVRVLADGPVSGGTHRVVFDASGLSSGVYLVRFEHPGGIATKMVQLLK